MTKMLAIIAVMCCIQTVVGYPGGAPTSQCVQMTPQSPHGSSQATASPYQITTNASSGYVPGRTYTVTISKISVSTPDFKGFLCQIRQVDSTIPVGTFAVADGNKAQTRDCTSTASSVTHKNRNTVTDQTFYWTASASPLGVGTQLFVRCTVVQQLATLWVGIASTTFQELALPVSTTKTTTTSASVITTARTTAATTAGMTAKPTTRLTAEPTTRMTVSSADVSTTKVLPPQQQATSQTTAAVMSDSAGRQTTDLAASQKSTSPGNGISSSPTSTSGGTAAGCLSSLQLPVICFLAIAAFFL